MKKPAKKKRERPTLGLVRTLQDQIDTLRGKVNDDAKYIERLDGERRVLERTVDQQKHALVLADDALAALKQERDEIFSGRDERLVALRDEYEAFKKSTHEHVAVLEENVLSLRRDVDEKDRVIESLTREHNRLGDRLRALTAPRGPRRWWRALVAKARGA